MIESTWRITIGLNNEADATPREAFATMLDDYAAFRKRLSQFESIKAMLIMRHPYIHPITGAETHDN